jgi:hypothetical protein
VTRDEGAEFTGRVLTRRARPRLAVFGFLAAIAGLVAFGIADRGGEVSPSSGSVATAMSSPTPTGPGPVPPAPSPDSAPIVSAVTEDMELTVRRHPETLFLHGDVLIDDVTWVFVSLRDERGRIAGWTSVSVPGGVNQPAGEGPALRFDVELAVPSEAFGGPLWVQVNAYDSSGAVASAEVGVAADGGQLEAPAAAGQESPAASVVRLTVLPSGRHLFVHGEVLTNRVIVVVVSLRDRLGKTLEIRSVDIPGGSTAFRLGAVDRFDVQFERPLPEDVRGATIWVTCYDRVGAVVGSAEVEVPATAG